MYGIVKTLFQLWLDIEQEEKGEEQRQLLTSSSITSSTLGRWAPPVGNLESTYNIHTNKDKN